MEGKRESSGYSLTPFCPLRVPGWWLTDHRAWESAREATRESHRAPVAAKRKTTDVKTIENYLERRSRLSNEGSRFTCPESCPRYGCKDPGLHVPSTLIDLVLQSAVLKSRPSNIYDRFYKIGWSPERTDSTAPQRIPYPLIESFIQGKLKETGFQKEISEKVARLNRLEERVSLVELRETIGEIQKPLGTEGFVIYNQFEGKSLRGYRGVRPRHR